MELWDSLVGNQLGASIVAVHVIQWLKKSRFFPLLTIDTYRANRFVSVFLAGASAVGFQFAMVGSLIDGGTVTITIPPLQALMTAVFRFALSYGAQEAYYRAAVNTERPQLNNPVTPKE